MRSVTLLRSSSGSSSFLRCSSCSPSPPLRNLSMAVGLERKSSLHLYLETDLTAQLGQCAPQPVQSHICHLERRYIQAPRNVKNEMIETFLSSGIADDGKQPPPHGRRLAFSHQHQQHPTSLVPS
jgi:hypothetical protein